MGEFAPFSGDVSSTGNGGGGGGDGGGGEAGGARRSNRSLWYFCKHPKIEYNKVNKREK